MKRNDRARKIRETVIATVYEMIRQGGVENVTAREAAEESGFTVRTVYKHFRNMDEIFWFTRNTVIEDFANHLEQDEGEADAESADPSGRLERQFLRYLDYFIANPELYRFLNFYRLDRDCKVEPAFHEQPEFPEKMKSAFGALISGGYINESDLNVVPGILILSVQGLLTSLVSGNDGLTPADARNQLKNIIKFVLEKRNGKNDEGPE